MSRIAATALLAVLLAGCSGSGLSGEYMYAPGYGFEFDGDAVYSHAGGDVARGEYTVDGSTVRICISIMCTELRLDGGCLVQEDGARYCRE